MWEIYSNMTRELITTCSDEEIDDVLESFEPFDIYIEDDEMIAWIDDEIITWIDDGDWEPEDDGDWEPEDE